MKVIYIEQIKTINPHLIKMSLNYISNDIMYGKNQSISVEVYLFVFLLSLCWVGFLKYPEYKNGLNYSNIPLKDMELYLHRIINIWYKKPNLGIA